MALIIDYPTTNYTAGGFIPMSNIGYTIAGENFTAPLNARVTSAKFYVAKGSGVTGNVTAKLYSTSGGVPNTVLATSNAIDASTFQELGGGGPDDNMSLVEFTFPTPYLITSGTVYAICMEKNNSGSIYMGRDTSSPTFAGTFYFYGGGWSSGASDSIFYLYGTEYFPNTSSFFNLM